ncbi:hypothetical protein D3C81_2205690 [compost metagenome]
MPVAMTFSRRICHSALAKTCVVWSRCSGTVSMVSLPWLQVLPWNDGYAPRSMARSALASMA